MNAEVVKPQQSFVKYFTDRYVNEEMEYFAQNRSIVFPRLHFIVLFRFCSSSARKNKLPVSERLVLGTEI